MFHPCVTSFLGVCVRLCNCILCLHLLVLGEIMPPNFFPTNALLFLGSNLRAHFSVEVSSPYLLFFTKFFFFLLKWFSWDINSLYHVERLWPGQAPWTVPSWRVHLLPYISCDACWSPPAHPPPPLLSLTHFWLEQNISMQVCPNPEAWAEGCFCKNKWAMSIVSARQLVLKIATLAF